MANLYPYGRQSRVDTNGHELTGLCSARAKPETLERIVTGSLVMLLAGLLAGCARPEVSVNAEYQERYSNPLISPGTKFAELPPAVQHTIRAEAGAANILDIVKTNSSDRVVYVVFLANWETFPPLYIASDGSVLYPDLTVAISMPQERAGSPGGGPGTGLTLSDLPPRVIQVVRQLAPDAEVGSISKETRAGQVVYIVTFRGRTRPTLNIAADGTVLRIGP